MHCSVVFRLPENASYMQNDIHVCVRRFLIQNNCVQLLWMNDFSSINTQGLTEKGVYLDYHVINQAKALLDSLSLAFPGLYAEIKGRYGPNPHNLMNSYDDLGGYFNVTLENGIVICCEDPIV